VSKATKSISPQGRLAREAGSSALLLRVFGAARAARLRSRRDRTAGNAIELLDLTPFFAAGERLRVERPGSTSTFVAHRLPPGHAVPVHAHEAFDEVFVVLGGEGTLEVGGETKMVRAPTAFLVARGVPHRLTVSGKGVMTLVVVKGLPP